MLKFCARSFSWTKVAFLVDLLSGFEMCFTSAPPLSSVASQVKLRLCFLLLDGGVSSHCLHWRWWPMPVRLCYNERVLRTVNPCFPMLTVYPWVLYLRQKNKVFSELEATQFLSVVASVFFKLCGSRMSKSNMYFIFLCSWYFHPAWCWFLNVIHCML